MMVTNLRRVAVPVAGLLLAAAPAQAQQATVTVTGSVMSGYDTVGTFGAAGRSLIGLPFRAVFTIAAQPGSTLTSAANLSYLSGTGAATPVSAVLTIGSGSYTFTGTRSGSARVQDGAGAGGTGTDVLNYTVDDTDFSAGPAPETFFYAGLDTLRDVLTGAGFTSFAPVSVTLADNAKGYAQIANRDPATGGYGATTYANLAVSSISTQVGAAVPEPATWMMLVAGFGLTGAALRRTRTTARVRLA